MTFKKRKREKQLEVGLKKKNRRDQEGIKEEEEEKIQVLLRSTFPSKILEWKKFKLKKLKNLNEEKKILKDFAASKL